MKVSNVTGNLMNEAKQHRGFESHALALLTGITEWRQTIEQSMQALRYAARE
jgi:hypothetical protein